MSLGIWDRTVLPAIPTARPVGTRFSYPGGMEG